MNLPNGAHARIDPDKVRDYLLDTAHPDSFGKASFFTTMGFQREEWAALADALRQVGQCSHVTKSMTSIHGDKYIVDGAIDTPNGRTVTVRTIWIIDTGEETPRLVTAYPREEEP